MLRAPYFQLKKTNHHFIMTGIKYKTALMPLLLTALLTTTPAIHTDAAKNRKATTAKAEGTKAVKLLTENMKAPLGLGTRTPRFSWQIQSGKNSTIQTAYRILKWFKNNTLQRWQQVNHLCHFIIKPKAYLIPLNIFRFNNFCKHNLYFKGSILFNGIPFCALYQFCNSSSRCKSSHSKIIFNALPGISPLTTPSLMLTITL